MYTQIKNSRIAKIILKEKMQNKLGRISKLTIKQQKRTRSHRCTGLPRVQLSPYTCLPHTKASFLQ